MNTKRTRQVIFRATEDEWEKIAAKIHKSGTSQQAFLLKTALGKKVICFDDMDELMAELRRQGNNLNQLTKKLNETGYIDYKNELPKLEKDLDEIWQRLNSYLRVQA